MSLYYTIIDFNEVDMRIYLPEMRKFGKQPTNLWIQLSEHSG